MLKKLSLRARLTLLSALVTAGVAAVLTAVSLFSADRIFVRDLSETLLRDEFTVHTEEPGQPDAQRPPSAEVRGYGAPPGPNIISVTPNTGGPAPERAAYTIQISLSRAGRRFSLWGVAGLLLAVLAGAGVTWLMAGRALKPVRELSDAIGEMGGDDLSRRVDPCGRQDEIGQLARSFNAMMDKVSASFERQKRFSANAAHELKTPLATIQVGLEVLELDEQPPPERMEKALSVAKANTERMIRLVDDLFLLSAREDGGPREEIPVDGLFSEILAELSPRIQAAGLTVSTAAPPGIRLTGSRGMLYRALFNLAENAVNITGRAAPFPFRPGRKRGWSRYAWRIPASAFRRTSGRIFSSPSTGRTPPVPGRRAARGWGSLWCGTLWRSTGGASMWKARRGEAPFSSCGFPMETRKDKKGARRQNRRPCFFIPLFGGPRDRLPRGPLSICKKRHKTFLSAGRCYFQGILI